MREAQFVSMSFPTVCWKPLPHKPRKCCRLETRDLDGVFLYLILISSIYCLGCEKGYIVKAVGRYSQFNTNCTALMIQISHEQSCRHKYTPYVTGSKVPKCAMFRHSAYLLNCRFNTYHTIDCTRFRHCRNAVYKLSSRNWVQSIIVAAYISK